VLERELAPVDPEAGMRINPLVKEGLDVVPAGGMRLQLLPGVIRVGRAEVAVAAEVFFEVSPPRLIEVRDQPLVLTDQVPRGYGQGTALPECMGRGTTVANCLVADSLALKVAPGPGAERYQEGVDWRADKAWGRVGRLPEGRIGATTTVFADYDVSLMRLDTLAVRSDGTVVLLRGSEHKMVPEPPLPEMYSTALCNLFIPYHCTQLTPELIYPIGPRFAEPGVVTLKAKAAQIPRTREKLAHGEDLTIVYWGDSVTCGGDASSEDKAFPLAFTNWLRCRYPASHIRHVNAGTGGWNSVSKLPLFEEQVMAHDPDLVIIEFVNDMGLSRELVFQNYSTAVNRIRERGGEVIILTPHFVRPDWMGPEAAMRTPETRAAVTYLREFAKEAGVGLADTSRRWEHLWIEGLPYLTLLMNAINHPDDRGHALFVEDLRQFFLASPGELRAKPVSEQNMPAAQP